MTDSSQLDGRLHAQNHVCNFTILAARPAKDQRILWKDLHPVDGNPKKRAHLTRKVPLFSLHPPGQKIALVHPSSPADGGATMVRRHDVEDVEQDLERSGVLVLVLVDLRPLESVIQSELGLDKSRVTSLPKDQDRITALEYELEDVSGGQDIPN
jgi:hypothetical protein